MRTRSSAIPVASSSSPSCPVNPGEIADRNGTAGGGAFQTGFRRAPKAS
ncbi:MAG: hypothetical protein IT372_13300 [Polyangiaceae bacterium]|nr:hypothetical protein [Polyangiaceae bacterium]